MDKISKEEVGRIADLAKLSLTEEELTRLSAQLTETVSYINILNELNPRIAGLGETNQVSGLSNVFREDEIDTGRMLSQEDSLSNGQNKYKGYFVVSKIL